MDDRENRNTLPAALCWGAARTRSRCEKVFHEFLIERQVPCFLPLIKTKHYANRQTRYFDKPLFSGYVFYDTGVIARCDVLNTHKVAQILQTKDSERLRKELGYIALALLHDQTLAQSRYKRKGRPVRVCGGPLKGIEGEVISINRRTRLILRATLLGQAAQLEIDAALVEPIL